MAQSSNLQKSIVRKINNKVRINNNIFSQIIKYKVTTLRSKGKKFLLIHVKG
jgi:hypothetical protein